MGEGVKNTPKLFDKRDFWRVIRRLPEYGEPPRHVFRCERVCAGVGVDEKGRAARGRRAIRFHYQGRIAEFQRVRRTGCCRRSGYGGRGSLDGWATRWLCLAGWLERTTGEFHLASTGRTRVVVAEVSTEFRSRFCM